MLLIYKIIHKELCSQGLEFDLAGSEFTNEDLRLKKIPANHIYVKASIKAKIVWAILGGIGLVISVAFRDALASLFV